MKFGGSVDGSVDGVGVGVGGCRGVAREGGGHVGSGSGEGDEQRLQEERAEVAGAARGARGGELSSVDLREEGDSVQVVHGLRRAEAAEGTADDGQEGALLAPGRWSRRGACCSLLPGSAGWYLHNTQAVFWASLFRI